MYSLSKILSRSRRFNLAASSFGTISKVETSSGSKVRAIESSGLSYYNKPQGLIGLYSTRDVFSRFFGIHKLSSMADAKDKGDEEDTEEGLSEPETFKTGYEDDSLFEELGSDVDAPNDGLEISMKHLNQTKTTKKRFHSELFESIVTYKSVRHVLEVWVKEGKDLTQEEVSLAIHNLRKRRSYDMGLQLWKWLQANTQFEFTEANYASQLDLVAKSDGVQKAESFLKEIPESFRGEIVYRTLLANCVMKHHVKKAEEIFNKMRDLKFPTSAFACNQLIHLYSKHERNKISDILLLMEKENIKPTRATYQFLINSKGLAGDIAGMDKLVEKMKEDGIKLDPELQSSLAMHYMSAGLKEEAKEVMKKMEETGLKENPWLCRTLLPLYAEIGDCDNVKRLSSFSEQTMRYDNCIAAIKAWGKLEKVEEAEAVFEKLVKKYKILPMLPFFALLNIYTEKKMLAKGKELVKRVANSGIKIGPSTWNALIKLHVAAGEVGKADMILNKAIKDNKKRPMFSSYMVILEEYGKRGDVYGAEKVFLMMKQAGYIAQLMPYESVVLAYVNAKTPAYGVRERLKADNVFPNKSLAAKLAQVDPFRKTPVSVLLD